MAATAYDPTFDLSELEPEKILASLGFHMDNCIRRQVGNVWQVSIPGIHEGSDCTQFIIGEGASQAHASADFKNKLSRATTVGWMPPASVRKQLLEAGQELVWPADAALDIRPWGFNQMTIVTNPIPEESAFALPNGPKPEALAAWQRNVRLYEALLTQSSALLADFGLTSEDIVRRRRKGRIISSVVPPIMTHANGTYTEVIGMGNTRKRADAAFLRALEVAFRAGGLSRSYSVPSAG